jgi:hypothetical protein
VEKARRQAFLAGKLIRGEDAAYQLRKEVSPGYFGEACHMSEETNQANRRKK